MLAVRHSLWQGDLSPLGCEAAPNPAAQCARLVTFSLFGAAAQPSRDKSPRHKKTYPTRCYNNQSG
ncbi:hypothetical protein C0J56_12165 [Pseudomonas fluorescens]|nr:hypothetical protein C0J56_12165 [Pseudomonas fluorescens]